MGRLWFDRLGESRSPYRDDFSLVGVCVEYVFGRMPLPRCGTRETALATRHHPTMRPTHSIRRKKDGLIVLSDAGVLLHANSRAQALLTFQFPEWTVREPLPRHLRTWIAETAPASHHSRGSVSEPLRIEREGRKLSIRVLTTEREKILLLHEARIPTDTPHRGIEILRSLGMTERECEVLFWIAEGKSNPAIGVILHIALSTVKKHLEHIFAKLGVENRTCAAARASDVLQSRPSSRPVRARRGRLPFPFPE